ncbi:MAG: class I SAM-dependent methyltransferase, partial [Hyphomicrobiaceae bacterium]|nr:class I SAM-dependent methyltransferase [Hyphomicrobiaceae bacterium]
MKTPKQAEQEQSKAQEMAGRVQAKNEADGGQFMDWFEDLYAGAGEDADLIPWADEEAHEGLVAWMASAPENASPHKGAKALDVGCGLGDNAVFIAQNGYEVMAIDLSQSAIDWAQKRFADSPVTFRPADLFQRPQALLGP